MGSVNEKFIQWNLMGVGLGRRVCFDSGGRNVNWRGEWIHSEKHINKWVENLECVELRVRERERERERYRDRAGWRHTESNYLNRRPASITHINSSWETCVCVCVREKKACNVACSCCCSDAQVILLAMW